MAGSGAAPPASAFLQIVFQQLLKQLVPVETADQRTGVIVVCDIGRIFREYITHNLVYRVVALNHEGVLHRRQDLPHLGLAVERGKFSRCVFHDVPSSFIDLMSILYQNKMSSKVENGDKLVKNY